MRVYFCVLVRKIMTSVVTAALASAFLQLAEKPVVEIHNIDGLGEIGLLQLSLAGQQKWSAAEKGMGAIVLLKNTVCDPATRELVLEQLSDEDLKKLPLKVLNYILEKVYVQNGIKTKGDEEEVELKNSKADQS